MQNVKAMQNMHNGSTKKEIFFYKDTMSYKDLGKKYDQSFQSIHNVHKLALKKLNKIVKKLSEDRSFFEPYS